MDIRLDCLNYPACGCMRSCDAVDRVVAKKSVLAAIALLVALLLVLLTFMQPVYAHDALPTAAQPLGWQYPWSCCSGLDCRQSHAGEVKETPQGYQITTTGEVVGYRDKRIKESPDGEFHWCAHQSGLDAGKTICLFVPPRSY